MTNEMDQIIKEAIEKYLVNEYLNKLCTDREAEAHEGMLIIQQESEKYYSNEDMSLLAKKTYHKNRTVTIEIVPNTDTVGFNGKKAGQELKEVIEKIKSKKKR